ncbi:MAG TPA: asparagine synthase-related protein, partial [Candidatus Binatia bacterium]|nr:asparagine synthase-related protein [Candidatus Binatia bacterium]
MFCRFWSFDCPWGTQVSGIAGIINLDSKPVDQQLLRRMTGFMAYRGPDAQEVWVDGNVGFGHTMLRTTQESHDEKQPCSLDGKVWITADARIDDRPGLIQKLEAGQPGDLRSATDVELILHAYHEWGEDCIKHLLGDFAFAIWDGRTQRLFCARDHFGVKLFYYTYSGSCFVFSNTLNCLRLHPAVSDELNEQTIADFLLFYYNPNLATTAFTNIERLPPGHHLTCSQEALRIERYWSLPTDGHIIRYKRAGDYIDHFRELLSKAVGDRLRTDRVAVWMSGGLDSTTLAATACEPRDKRSVDIRAYCMVYDRLVPDGERYYSGLVAKSLGIPIQYLVADNYTLFDRWDDPELHRPEPVEEPLLATY